MPDNEKMSLDLARAVLKVVELTDKERYAKADFDRATETYERERAAYTEVHMDLTIEEGALLKIMIEENVTAIKVGENVLIADRLDQGSMKLIRKPVVTAYEYELRQRIDDAEKTESPAAGT